MGATTHANRSTRCASSRAPATVGPPSTRIDWISRRPSASSPSARNAAPWSACPTSTSTPAARSASTRSGAASDPASTITGISRAVCTSTESRRSRACGSNTTRVARRTGAGSTSRAVSDGSSASAVPIPTPTASISARQRCTSARASGPEIHRVLPVRVATRPSSDAAIFSITSGRPVAAHVRNGEATSRA